MYLLSIWVILPQIQFSTYGNIVPSNGNISHPRVHTHSASRHQPCTPCSPFLWTAEVSRAPEQHIWHSRYCSDLVFMKCQVWWPLLSSAQDAFLIIPSKCQLEKHLLVVWTLCWPVVSKLSSLLLRSSGKPGIHDWDISIWPLKYLTSKIFQFSFKKL